MSVLERNNKTKLLESIAVLVADDIGYGVWAVSFPWEVVEGGGSGSRNRLAIVAKRAKKKEEQMFDMACSSPLDFLFATCASSELKWENTGGFIMGGEPDPYFILIYNMISSGYKIYVYIYSFACWK